MGQFITGHQEFSSGSICSQYVRQFSLSVGKICTILQLFWSVSSTHISHRFKHICAMDCLKGKSARNSGILSIRGKNLT